MSREASDTKVWSSLLVCLLVLNLLSSSMAQVNTSGTPLLIARLEGSETYAGFLVGVFVVCAMVSRLLAGPISDHMGRRRVMVCACAIYIAGCGFPVVFGELWSLLPARVLQGCGYAALHTAESASAADVIPEEKLGEGLGHYGIGQAVAMALGPAMAIGLVGSGYRTALAVGAGLLALCALALATRIGYEKNPDELPASCAYRKRLKAAHNHLESPVEREDLRSAVAAVVEPSALRGGIPLLIASVAVVFFMAFSALYASERGYVTGALFFVIAAATSFVVRLFAANIIDKLRARMVLAIALCSACVALLAMFGIRSQVAFALSGIGYGAFLGLLIPLLNTVAVRSSAPHRIGACNALFFCCYDAGIGLGAALLGTLVDTFGFSALLIASLSSLALSFASSFPCFGKS